MRLFRPLHLMRRGYVRDINRARTAADARAIAARYFALKLNASRDWTPANRYSYLEDKADVLLRCVTASRRAEVQGAKGAALQRLQPSQPALAEAFAAPSPRPSLYPSPPSYEAVMGLSGNGPMHNF